eukprot:2801608-Alexandrium_andersonii.AAC.1
MLAWSWAGLRPEELVERGVSVASWGGLARAVRARLVVSDLADGDPRFDDDPRPPAGGWLCTRSCEL